MAVPLIHIWDGEQETLSGHTDKVTAAKFKLTRHEAVTGSRDRTVKEWDLGRAYCETQPPPRPPGPSQAAGRGFSLLSGSGSEIRRHLGRNLPRALLSVPHWCFLPVSW